MAKRDSDFSTPVKNLLAKRVGYLCSNPECRTHTIGASENDAKTALIGVAAHITAASQGGARYDENLSITERQDYSNGIWLCSNHARLIDIDECAFSKELLLKWRKEAENESRQKLKGVKTVTNNYNPILEADLIGRCTIRAPLALSDKNPKEFHDGRWVYVTNNIPIYWWRLTWRYKLVVYNNSSFNAYNIKIESVGENLFSELDSLGKFVNLGALANLDLTAIHYETVESVYTVVNEKMEQPYPANIENVIFRITYQDEERKNYSTLVTFKNDEAINSR